MKQGRGVGEKRGFNFRQGRSYKASQKTLEKMKKGDKEASEKVGVRGR